jgi:histidine triad (HIT) family protein
MQDSLFTMIIKGEIPSYTIYEDASTLAFLDIHPAQPGHTLVIPKRQVEFVWDLDDTDYQALMRTVKKVALHLRTTLALAYVGERVIGIDVPHAHVHLVPFTTLQDFRHEPDAESESDHPALANMATRLRMQDEL